MGQALKLALSEGLRASRLLGILDEERLRRLRAEGDFRDFAAGSVVQLASGRQAAVFFVLKGAFRISMMTPAARFVTIRSAHVGDQFGEISLFSEEVSRNHFIHCDEAGRCFVLPARCLLELTAEHPKIAHALLHDLAADARRRAERIYELATLDIRARLLAEINRLSLSGVQRGSALCIEPAPTHEALAAQVGSSREGVTRCLQEFVRLGLMRVPRRRTIEITDLPAFRSLVARRIGGVAAVEP